MKNLIYIIAGFVLMSNTLLSNGDYCDIPLPHYSYDQHQVALPEEPKIDNHEFTEINLIYTILLKSDNEKLRICDSPDCSMILVQDDPLLVLNSFTEMVNSEIEIEK